MYYNCVRQTALLVDFCRIVGHMVAQLVEALNYKPEGIGFDSRWCYWHFSLTSFRPQYGPGVAQSRTEMSTMNISLGVKAAGS